MKKGKQINHPVQTAVPFRIHNFTKQKQKSHLQKSNKQGQDIISYMHPSIYWPLTYHGVAHPINFDSKGAVMGVNSIQVPQKLNSTLKSYSKSHLTSPLPTFKLPSFSPGVWDKAPLQHYWEVLPLCIKDKNYLQLQHLSTRTSHCSHKEGVL